jgi:ABC-type transport system involved in cytochrome c biogenesis permease subunit
MESLLTIRFAVSLLYAAAAVSYVLLLRGNLQKQLLPSRLLRVALVLHLGEILIRGAEAGAAGGAPFVSSSGFVSIFAFLLGLIYLVLEFQFKVHSLGAFHISLVFFIQLAGAVLKQPVTAIPTLKTGYLVALHVVPTAVAYAALTASFVAAVVYLLLDRQLRKKSFGVLMRGLPNLDLVEAVNTAGVRIGMPLLALGAIIGVLAGYREWGAAYKWDPKNYVTLAIIAIFALQLLLRRFAGFIGRRSVLLSCVGFGVILLGITVINVFFSTVHGLT